MPYRPDQKSELNTCQDEDTNILHRQCQALDLFRLVLGLQTTANDLLLLIREPRGVLRAVCHQPQEARPDEHRRQAFSEKEPLPAGQASNAVH